MHWKFFFGTVFLWMLFFESASASLRINEIAWMGTMESPTNEWIELYNDTSPSLDLSGWKIVAENGSPTITLSGTVPSQGYFLIERTDDESVSDVKADIIASFGTGLSNSGETLQLKDSAGVVVDTVVGGRNWGNIGGNNVTKESAQLTASGWVTGVPTPRRENVKPKDKIPAVTVNADPPPTAKATTQETQTAKITSSSAMTQAAPHQKATTTTVGSTVLWQADASGRGTIIGFLNTFLSNNMLLFWAFLLTLLSAVAGFIIVRSQKSEHTPADEYRIIEDIIETADDE